jgi:long-chain acyl-CoA synthetase
MCARSLFAELASQAQLRRDVEAAALQMYALGVRRGSVVALAMPNTVELITVFLAATRLGAAAAPLNPAYVLDDFTFSLQVWRSLGFPSSQA